VAALYYYPLELGTRDKASDKKLSDKPHTNGTKKATVRRYDYSAIDREEQGSDT
jgi:hypothetical protein